MYLCAYAGVQHDCCFSSCCLTVTRGLSLVEQYVPSIPEYLSSSSDLMMFVLLNLSFWQCPLDHYFFFTSFLLTSALFDHFGITAAYYPFDIFMHFWQKMFLIVYIHFNWYHDRSTLAILTKAKVQVMVVNATFNNISDI